ncbi:MAG: CsgG/HfaB family protein [Nanoarchaeota archaeon]|nr:CsgG/HfaB family protein [Nanoarchaeota archaeon]
MRNQKYIVLCILIICFSLVFSNLTFSQELPRIAVVGITSTAPGYFWRSDSPLSLGATDLMINALLSTNRFRVFERAKLDLLLQEQNFQHFSGLVDQTTAVKLGKMIGVDAILTGSLTNIAFATGGGIKIGPLNVKKSSVKVVMTIRIIDVTTGEILFSTVQEEKASKSAVSGVLPIPIPGGIGFSHQEAVDVLSAIELICNKVVLNFVAKIDKKNIAVSSAPLEGYVVKVESTSSGAITQVYINLGESSSIQVGDEIRIYREGEVILDPKTNEILDRELDLIAQARITTIKDKLSVALVTKIFRNMPIQQLDIVEVMR